MGEGIGSVAPAGVWLKMDQIPIIPPMNSNSEEIEVGIGQTLKAGNGTVFLSVPCERVAAYGNPETTVDVIVGAVGCENQETTMRVGQRLEFEAGEVGMIEIRLLASTPPRFLVTGLKKKKAVPGGTTEEDSASA